MTELKVTGCFFTPQMRTLCSLLDLNDIQYHPTDVDVFTNKRKSQSFDAAGYNVPIISIGAKKIVGDGPSLYKFVCLAKNLQNTAGAAASIDDQFYPKSKMNVHKKKIIDMYLDYIELMVRRNSSRLTKLIIQKLLSVQMIKQHYTDDQIEDADEEMMHYNKQENEAQIQDEIETFFDIILGNLEQQIASYNNVQIQAMYGNQSFSQLMASIMKGEQVRAGKSNTPKVYITGPDFTVADIAMFNELQNVMEILKLNAANSQTYEQNFYLAMESKYPCVFKWMNSMNEVPSIRTYNSAFEQAYLQKMHGVKDSGYQ